jgi:hypothetical protein
MKSLVIPAIWAAVAAVTFGGLLRYSFAPGLVGSVPATWPATAVAAESDTGHRLLVFLHPHCPCNRATVRVLERIVAQAAGQPRIQAILVRPNGSTDGWEQTSLRDAVAAIPGVRTTVDPGGKMASTFGARTSGHVVLYDRSGRLAFSGGITPSRGHEGDSTGVDAVLAILRGQLPTGAAPLAAPVYGCALRNAPPSPDAQLLSESGE